MPKKAPTHQSIGAKTSQRSRREKRRDPLYGSRWEKLRVLFLQRNPLCVHCYDQGKIVVATVVDHIIPWKTGKTREEQLQLFWDEGNWQSLCRTSHARKSISEGSWLG